MKAVNALKKSSRSGSNEGAFTQITYKVNRKDALRGYLSSTLWEGKSQSMHQEFKCGHYKTDKIGRKKQSRFFISCRQVFTQKSVWGTKSLQSSWLCCFVSTSKNRKKKITFSKRLKQAMAQEIKTIHLAFIDTRRISPNIKSKKWMTELIDLKIRIFIMRYIICTYPILKIAIQ